MQVLMLLTFFIMALLCSIMVLAIDNMDGRGLSNKTRRERLPKETKAVQKYICRSFDSS